MQNNAAVFRTQETLEEGTAIGGLWKIISFRYEFYEYSCDGYICGFSGCQLIDKAWESFHDVKLQDRSLIW